MLSHLPNALTLLRGLAGPAILVIVLTTGWHQVAFSLFLGAVITDLADGWLARQLGATSALGSILDPVADKFLVDSTWLALALAGWAPWWLVGPILIRDLAVIVGFFSLGGRLHRPHLLGRLMVSVEGVALPVLLFREPWLDVHWPTVGLILGVLSLVLAVSSAGVYLFDVLRGRAGPGRAGVVRGRPWQPPSTPT